MRVVCVSSEVAPFSKTGGLADVAGALPDALVRVSGGQADVVVVTPLYRSVKQKLAAGALENTGIAIRLPGLDVGTFRVFRRPGAAPVFFYDQPELYDRDTIYGGGSAYDANGFSDNAVRYGALCLAAARYGAALCGGPVDVFHGQDWQAALLPALVPAESPGARVLLTIHNLAYQGVFPSDALEPLGLVAPPASYLRDGGMNLLAGGIAEADGVSTVSPSYGLEITIPGYGQGLAGLLGERGVRGILNGIDPVAWDPAQDLALAATYSAGSLAGKSTCRRSLCELVGWAQDDPRLLVGVVSRLVHQKGIDLLADLVPRLGRIGVGVVVLGTGETALEERLTALAAEHPGDLSLRVGFDDTLARRIIGGCDALLVPSRFEPCGLTQLYAMRYGTVPIVRGVGGLRDTVRDPGDAQLAQGKGTGFSFVSATSDAVEEVLTRAARMYRDDRNAWRATQRAGMARDSSWHASAEAWWGVMEDLVVA